MHPGNEVYLFPSQRTGKPIKQKQLTESAWAMREADLMVRYPSMDSGISVELLEQDWVCNVLLKLQKPFSDIPRKV